MSRASLQIKARRNTLLLLATVLLVGVSFAVLPGSEPAITSLSVKGSNLVFIASIPMEMERTILEMRPTLTNTWQEVALLDVSAEGGNVEHRAQTGGRNGVLPFKSNSSDN